MIYIEVPNCVIAWQTYVLQHIYLLNLKTFVEKALFTLISAVFVVFIVVCKCPYSFSDRPTLLIPLLKGPVSQM